MNELPRDLEEERRAREYMDRMRQVDPARLLRSAVDGFVRAPVAVKAALLVPTGVMLASFVCCMAFGCRSKED